MRGRCFLLGFLIGSVTQLGLWLIVTSLPAESREFPCHTGQELRVEVRYPDGSRTAPLKPERAARLASKLRAEQREDVESGEPASGFVGRKWVAVEREMDWFEATPEQMRALVRCLAPHFSLEGSEERILAIEECESGCRPEAHNPAGYCGAFQQDEGAWPGRAAQYYQEGADCFDGYAATYVSLAMMAEGGWSHWEACDPGA